MKKSGSQKSKSPSQLIDARIKELGDFRANRAFPESDSTRSLAGDERL